MRLCSSGGGEVAVFCRPRFVAIHTCLAVGVRVGSGRDMLEEKGKIQDEKDQ